MTISNLQADTFPDLASIAFLSRLALSLAFSSRTFGLIPGAVDGLSFKAAASAIAFAFASFY